ncbi:uncharacterized protein LOC101847785 [Aplysia californica]|uniref:Uncharacterized protein LOC101847785 n=1 Tax=Aplysia californica TaxID=6500 RepID=A0ABM0JCA3_APLCA|nr:uncharacterized protein LOC101847785 [Aplysia californica]
MTNNAGAVLLWVVALCYTSVTFGLSIGLQSMEENCILSFVVPRDKMKSSCQLDEKVTRRLNTAEMKVNIYSQQVASLQLQLDKQRLLDADRLDKLEQQITNSASSMDMNFLVERRLSLLEKEFEMLHHDMNAAPTTGERRGQSERPSADSGSSRTSEALNKIFPLDGDDTPSAALPTMIRSIVQSEIKVVMENFTRKFENYVRDQIILYNQVFSMLPRRNNGVTISSGRTAGSPSSRGRSQTGESTPTEGRGQDKNNRHLGEFAKVKAKLDDTGDKIARQVGTYIKNVTSSTSSSRSHPNTSDSITLDMEGVPRANNSGIILNEDFPDTNYSYSGDHPEHQHGKLDTDQPLTGASGDISDAASSRITNPSGKARNSSTSSSSRDKDGRNWKENMIQDEKDRQAEMEVRLKEEITNMLYTPLAELMSLVEKQTARLEQQMKELEEKENEANSELTSQVKDIDQSVQTIEMQVESLSQGFQDYSVMLNKIKPLESEVAELEKNITALAASEATSSELEEQAKKVKKLERLMGVYHQSLEHYRNETKHEYRDMRDVLNKETAALRAMAGDIDGDVNSAVKVAVNKLNNTYMEKIAELNKLIELQGDNVMLAQIDISAVERQLDSKATRSDREIEDMEDAIKHLTNKQRDFRKRFDLMEQSQMMLGEVINTTAKDVFDLKTELKLNVLDEWLPMTFEYDSSRTECFGEQYVRRSKYKDARLVGVVLCSPTRYKIFLATSLHSTFLNIGDGNGMGEDHCEFVGATRDSHIMLSPFKVSYGAVQGYARNHWGQEPKTSFLNTIKPTPNWYECGVSIP